MQLARGESSHWPLSEWNDRTMWFVARRTSDVCSAQSCLPRIMPTTVEWYICIHQDSKRIGGIPHAFGRYDICRDSPGTHLARFINRGTDGHALLMAVSALLIPWDWKQRTLLTSRSNTNCGAVFAYSRLARKSTIASVNR